MEEGEKLLKWLSQYNKYEIYSEIRLKIYVSYIGKFAREKFVPLKQP
jgi:hypothetical protein